MSGVGLRLICGAIFLLGLLEGCEPPAPPADPGMCWIEPIPRQFQPLDRVGNLETCGARLEVIYLRRRRPVTGAYGGVYVLVDAAAIDAAAPNGPRTRLFDPSTRRTLDAAIERLRRMHGEQVLD